MKADRIVFTLAAAASCALLSGLPASAQQDTANGTTAQQGTTKDTAKDTAKGTLEEIVVTAQKREQNIQDVPSSIVALSGKEILNQGSVDIQSMSQTMPNLFIRHNLTGDQLLMRGIGTGVDNEGFEQAVAQFVDGVYYGRATLDQNEVFDVERMEVVRGPQPTYAGQSATAGAISIYDRKPGKTLGGDASVSYGKFNELSVNAGIGGPVTDTFGIRLSGRFYDLPNTDYHNYDGSAVGNKRDWAVRLITTWNPTDTFDFTFKYEHQSTFNFGQGGSYSICEMRPQYSRGNGFLDPGMPAACALNVAVLGADLNNRHQAYQGGSLDARAAVDALNAASGAAPGSPGYWGYNSGPGVTGLQAIPYGLNKVKEFAQPQNRTYNFDVLMGNFDWQLGDLTLTSTSSFLRYSKNYILDPDYSAFALFSDHRAEKFQQTSQEFRLTSPVAQTVSWMIGASYLHHNLETTINVYAPTNFGAPFLPPTATAAGFGGTLFESADWYNAFAAATWNVTKDFRLNLGGRYQNVSKEGRLPATYAYLLPGAAAFSDMLPFPGGAQAVGNLKNGDFLPEASLQWDMNDNVMAYVKYSNAAKAGGFVMSPIFFGGVPNPFTYKPERAQGFEGGIKANLLGDSLQLAVDYYYTKYKNLQVSVYDAPSNAFITTNAGRSHTQGLEFDGRWLPIPDQDFTIGFTGNLFGDASYDEFNGASCNQLEAKLIPAQCAVGVSRNGVALPYSSKWQVGINPNYQFSVESGYRITLDANLLRNSGYNDSDQQDPLDHQPAYWRIDTRVALTPENGPWELAIYGRNLTNTRVLLQSQSNFMATTSDPATLRDTWGPNLDFGMTFGAQVTYHLGSED